MPGLCKLKKRLVAIKEEWGPLMAAKEEGDEEYNFPAGGGPKPGQNSSSDKTPSQNEKQPESTDADGRTSERVRRSPDLDAIAE
ncbi:hypothetical protein BDW60DRAFT_202681 [Aspergillus nidulans var. acristatus]|jgi:hypothetical protein